MNKNKNTKSKKRKLNQLESSHNSNLDSNASLNSSDSINLNTKKYKKKNKDENNEEQVEEDIYEVEEIVGKKVAKNKVYYKVKWQNYPSELDTWEPIENLYNVLDLVEDFEQKDQELKNNKLKNKKVPNHQSSYLDSENDLVEEDKEIACPSNLKKGFGLVELVDNDNNIITDKPARIKYAKFLDKKMFFMIQWEKRSDGIERDECLISHELIKKNYPFTLIDFYESRIRCVKLKSREEADN